MTQISDFASLKIPGAGFVLKKRGHQVVLFQPGKKHTAADTGRFDHDHLFYPKPKKNSAL